MCEFKLLHVGINHDSEEEARKTAELLCTIFNLPIQPKDTCIFAGTFFDCVKFQDRGQHGHIAMGTEDLPAAIEEFASKGFAVDMDHAAYSDDGRLKSVYLDVDFSGFKIHVMQL